MFGLRQVAVSRMEKNPTQISFDVLMKIASNTGVIIEELVHCSYMDKNIVCCKK